MSCYSRIEEFGHVSDLKFQSFYLTVTFQTVSQNESSNVKNCDYHMFAWRVINTKKNGRYNVMILEFLLYPQRQVWWDTMCMSGCTMGTIVFIPHKPWFMYLVITSSLWLKIKMTQLPWQWEKRLGNIIGALHTTYDM